MNKRLFFFIVLFLSCIFCLIASAQDLSQNNKLGERAVKLNDKQINNPFGVLEFLHWSHPWNNNKYSRREDLDRVVALMKEAGVGFVRMDFLWQDIEPEKDKFEFEKYDYIVELLGKNSIGILGILHYSTDWISSCGKWNCPPRDNSLFISYALRVIERYKHKIKYWEVWNEPDSSTYWTPQDGLKSYCTLLKEVYLAAKKTDPDCKILNGGLAGGASSINHLYDNGSKDYFDILNIHIFENPLNPNAIKAVTAYLKLAYKIMSRNGDVQKKIWVTEIGSPGVKRGQEVKNWWLGENPSERRQAEWLKLVYTELTKNKSVEKVFWAFFRDCKGHWDNGVDYFGLVRWDFSKKPAFLSYKRCFSNWKNSR